MHFYFRPTDDSFATLASLDIVSTNPNEEEVRAVIEEQLELHSLGNDIQVKGTEGFSFRSPQGNACTFDKITQKTVK